MLASHVMHNDSTRRRTCWLAVHIHGARHQICLFGHNGHITSPHDMCAQPCRASSTRAYAVNDVSDCDVYILDASSQVTVDDSQDSTFFIGPVAGSAFVRDCKNCKCALDAHGLRVLRVLCLPYEDAPARDDPGQHELAVFASVDFDGLATMYWLHSIVCLIDAEPLGNLTKYKFRLQIHCGLCSIPLP